MDEWVNALLDMPEEAWRESVRAEFPVVFHDLTCETHVDDRIPATLALMKANWSLREAFEAWYDRWLSRD